jgi:hypothetical protein
MVIKFHAENGGRNEAYAMPEKHCNHAYESLQIQIRWSCSMLTVVNLISLAEAFCSLQQTYGLQLNKL